MNGLQQLDQAFARLFVRGRVVPEGQRLAELGVQLQLVALHQVLEVERQPVERQALEGNHLAEREAAVGAVAVFDWVTAGSFVAER